MIIKKNDNEYMTLHSDWYNVSLSEQLTYNKAAISFDENKF